MDVSRVEVADGVWLNVHSWDGDSVPYLLVHGLASNARLWDGVAADLAGRGHRVVAIDQRGHGRSDKPEDGYDFERICDDLAAVIGAAGLERPVVAGQSWGGNVVVELGARRPELVRGIACVDGGWIDLTRFATWEACEAAMAPPRTTGLAFSEIEAMMRGRHPEWPESGIQGALACFEVRGDGTVAPWLSFERHLRILRAMWEQRIGDVFPRVAVPVLLLPCDDGSSARVERKRSEVAEAEAALPVSRTHWFAAEHDVHAQYPHQVAGVLVSALEEGFFA
ncbi:MAG TPA: alpha/beta hydrolase [Acidimicrobiales bacterium]|nr:alpha/beta hydrolase [Acidimicrobiales bacterium]